MALSLPALQTVLFPASYQADLINDSLNSVSDEGTAERPAPAQPDCENKLQHLANEQDTTLWRQHRSLTAVKGSPSELFHGDRLQTTHLNTLKYLFYNPTETQQRHHWNHTIKTKREGKIQYRLMIFRINGKSLGAGTETGEKWAGRDREIVKKCFGRFMNSC